MAKDKQAEALYRAEGKRRNYARKTKRKDKISDKVNSREARKLDCCKGDPNCNGTTDCMWY